MIEVKNIHKSFGKKRVLNGVDLQIPKGKITSLIGSNGAGKTTLLSIMSRLLSQDEGEVLVEGKSIEEYKSKILAQRLAILRQSNHIRLRLTVRELVSFGRFPYSQDKLTADDEEMIDKAMDFMDLQGMGNRYVDELSGGQKQRAYMAMVVAQDTDYLLLDEPLNNLDMKHSQMTMKSLRQLSDEWGKTIVIVLHDINFASHYSDYIAALKEGRVKYFSQTHEVMNEDVLRDIYDMEISVSEKGGYKVCNYYV